MQYLLILADGMADYNIAELGNMTPLQYANTPNIDFLAANSMIGMVKTIPDGLKPGSDVANLSVMGYDPGKSYSGRSSLEAVSMGVELGDSDLALRCNLVTLSDAPDYADRIMVDYSCGEISTEDAAVFINDLQRSMGNASFEFYAGISYRHLLVWKTGRDKKLVLTPPHDVSDRVITPYLPQGPDGKVLFDMMKQSAEILSIHPLNKIRMEKGLKPASSAWFWGEGSKPSLQSFKDKYGLSGSVVTAVDLVRGLGISAGLTPVKVEGATGGVHTNFAGKAHAALEELKRGQDFVYVHIESPDEAGHQGSLESKIWSIEQIDQLVFGEILRQLDSFNDLRIMLLPDHPTPISLKTHTSEPVPFMIYDKAYPQANLNLVYNEGTSAAAGRFIANGHELMDLFINS
ncbi:MAG: cofactor-independent phosphoglycerate mutase [Deltaproteobacteria bacterium]